MARDKQLDSYSLRFTGPVTGRTRATYPRVVCRGAALSKALSPLVWNGFHSEGGPQKRAGDGSVGVGISAPGYCVYQALFNALGMK